MPYLSVDVDKILHFFDEPQKQDRTHATSIVAVAGEDLGAGLLKHYLESQQGAAVDILPQRPTTGKREGPRLDRWIEVTWPGPPKKTKLFQTEIKNWSAHAIGGKRLPVNVSQNDLNKFQQDRWRELWDEIVQGVQKLGNGGPYSGLMKVLAPMRLPTTRNSAHGPEPLLVLWTAFGPGNCGALFDHELPQPMNNFERIWFFSMSSYLRHLRRQSVFRIDLDMPDAVSRIGLLKRLFP